MRVVVVTGTRHHTPAVNVAVFSTLTRAHNEWPFEMLAQGEAAGADTFSKNWALGVKVPTLCVPANWGKHGKAAGPIRNRLMLDLAEQMSLALDVPLHVFAFPSPDSRGTWDCANEAERRGFKVTVTEVNHA